MKITYMDTQYNRVATLIVDDLIYFSEDRKSIYFASHGRVNRIEIEYVISIERAE